MAFTGATRTGESPAMSPIPGCNRPPSGIKKALTILEINSQVNAALHKAILNERSKRWNKVADNYRELLRLVSSDCLPAGYQPPSWLSMLLFECHYHLGLALQNLQEHRKAISHYSKAIQAVSIPKNGCLAGCNTNSCLMTPLYSRRAFANAKAGNIKTALKDAEKAVVLDSRNPDVFCIRALVRATNDDVKHALQDVEVALRKNSRHLCALLLRGSLTLQNTLEKWDELGMHKDNANIDHVKACSINPDCHCYLDVRDFNHPLAVSFYERFLYSLGVPHTISEINLPEPTIPCVSPRSISSKDGQSSVGKTVSVSDLSMSVLSLTSIKTTSTSKSTIQSERMSRRAFKAGTTMQYNNGMEVADRRKNYSNAIREHVTRPKTAQQYLLHLEKQRQRMLVKERLQERRPNSDKDQRQPPSHESSYQVFQNVNIKNAPRMYYRPWLGDKLPTADIDRRQWLEPPFKV